MIGKGREGFKGLGVFSGLGSAWFLFCTHWDTKTKRGDLGRVE